MYAIAFDLDTRAAKEALGDETIAYKKIRGVLEAHGFEGQQGSLYFGRPDSTPVDCVLAVQEIDKRFSWFSRVVRDLRMLRVEEQNNLLPALSTELRFDQSDSA